MNLPANTMAIRACQMYGIGLQDLRGPSRLTELCEARYALIVALREVGLSYPVIGRCINRNHSTMMHGHNRGLALCKTQMGFADIVGEIVDAAFPEATKALKGPWSVAA